MLRFSKQRPRVSPPMPAPIILMGCCGAMIIELDEIITQWYEEIFCGGGGVLVEGFCETDER